MRCWIAALAIAGCKPATPAAIAPSDQVRFGDRAIALSPYLQGYPYAGLIPIFDADGRPARLLYDQLGERRTLRQISLGEAIPDLAKGEPVGDVDWSARSRWEGRWHGPTTSLWYAGDERNDERINLWRLPLDSGEPVAITDEPYLYGWSFSPAEDRVAIVARRGEGPYESCVETLATDGSDRVRHVCDTPAATFTWTEPSWAPDARGVVVEVNVAGQRDRSNVAWVPFDDPAVHLLLDPGATRTQALPVAPWLDDDRFVLVDDSPGLPRIGVFDVAKGSVDWKVQLDRDLSSLHLLGRVLVGVLHRPDGDQLVSWDPETGAELGRIAVDGELDVLGDDERSKLLIRTTSARSPFSTAWITVGAGGELASAPWLALPADVAGRIVQCEVEAVTFPTHDTDPATGQPRLLHGFLYTPKEPLEPPAARVISFYGGANRFDVDAQVYCEAGVATFSPAVRGSAGYGADFYRLNDKDLGGDEIADLFHAARFLVGRGYPEDRIGLWGRSHGGYATMRAMTFPPGTNGHDAVFPFAFGLAEAGFSDIVTFHDGCNIPDWVLLEAGDPVTEREKLLDRSPLHHVDLLQEPLLMVHGENDNRVPVTESRQMAAACASAGKACTYLEVPGQGHRVQGLANEQLVWQARMSFLEQVLLAE